MFNIVNPLVEVLLAIATIWIIIEVIILLFKRVQKAKVDIKNNLGLEDDNNGKTDTTNNTHK